MPVPKIVTFDAMNHFEFSPYRTIGEAPPAHEALGVEAKDGDVADVLLSGEGFLSTIKLVNTKRAQSSIFKIHALSGVVATLEFAICDSIHDFLYETLRLLAPGFY
ncbi:hypothetical protein D9619_008781 [Psilocybe cf. subviscida]|uniref:Uncharacterized protein n=1 Tax=Psilocybe cf. subviscida TaxID=2480587 RepID=A0A8H5BAB3_9AGAR|nr:hypothetical protein D9619_008781 [Psilocybe cf. subviscida]